MTDAPRGSEAHPPVDAEAGGVGATEGPTYYDRPAIKEPVWIWSVPAYFHVGGVTAGAALLGAATQHRDDLRDLTTRCRWLAASGALLSTGLLIHDLGRPARFLNMLRVFRPTSAMSMGSWTLAATATAAAGSAVLPALGATGLGNLAGAAAGVGAPVLGTYTGVLLADTSVPVWQHTRRALPALFGASALAGATATLDLVGVEGEAARITHRLGIVSRLAELEAAAHVEHQAKAAGVQRPLEEGVSGQLWQASKVLTLLGLLVSILPLPTRARQVASGLLGTLAGLALRFGIFRAGISSARDPHATFAPQRAVASPVDGAPTADG